MTSSRTSTADIGVVRILTRGLTRRCPVCGERDVFDDWFNQKPCCGECGFVFERQEGQFIGAIGVNTVVSFVAIIVTMTLGFVLTAPDFSLPWILGTTMAVSVLVPLLFFPVSKTLWAAIDMIMIPLEETEAPLRQRPHPKNE